MADQGSLTVRVTLDQQQAIRAVDIASSRPAVSELLSRRAPEAALALAGLLFQVCRHAQGAAAENALAAAGWQRRTPGVAGQPEHLVCCELLSEHLWRLMLDWPATFGLSAHQLLFRGLYGELRSARNAGGLPAGLLGRIEREWLGVSCAEWLALDSLDHLLAWCGDCASPAAALCAQVALIDSAARSPEPAPLLEDQAAAELRSGWGATIDAGFPARPHRGGEARETGALCWHAAGPLLCDLLQRRPARVLARLIARIRDTLLVISGGAGPRIDASGDGAGTGLALVRTARGLLLHQVHLEGGRVAAWRVVAPTEWNFHPAGPLVRGLRGLRFPDAPLRERWVRAQLLSLDPCVDYRIEVQHA